MVIRRRGILLIGEQARQLGAIAQRHREMHLERRRRRRVGLAGNVGGFVGMVALEYRGRVAGHGGPRGRNAHSQSDRHEKKARPPNLTH